MWDGKIYQSIRHLSAKTFRSEPVKKHCPINKGYSVFAACACKLCMRAKLTECAHAARAHMQALRLVYTRREGGGVRARRGKHVVTECAKPDLKA